MLFFAQTSMARRGVVLACACALVPACGDDEHEHDHDVDAAISVDAAIDAPAVQAVALRFAAEVEGTPFACGQSFTGIGSAASNYVATDFRFFVHDLRLTGTGGEVPVALDVNEWQTADGIALLDFENGGTACQTGTTATHTAVTGTVPPGTYTGISFKVGVPFARNHLDATTAQAPLNVPAMYWAWSSGYKFIKADGTVGGAGFNLHLGSTGCNATGSTPPSSPCTSPNVIDVTFTGYAPATSVIVADIGRVLADVDVSTNTAQTAPGCMSFPGDPECNTILPKLGLAYGGNPALAQSFFALE
jgi:uncharacterized repeat protein (TIGR04052 family)